MEIVPSVLFSHVLFTTSLTLHHTAGLTMHVAIAGGFGACGFVYLCYVA